MEFFNQCSIKKVKKFAERHRANERSWMKSVVNVEGGGKKVSIESMCIQSGSVKSVCINNNWHTLNKKMYTTTDDDDDDKVRKGLLLLEE